MMASITLPQTFINLLATGDFISGFAATGRTEDYSQPGDVRTYAGGRRRAIVSVGEVGSLKFQLRLVPRITVDTLHSWIGQMVQYRDPRGRRVFGVFYGITVEEVPMLGTWCPPALAVNGAWHVGVELTVVTASEGV